MQAKIHIPVELKITVLVFSILYYMFIINKSFFSFENNLEANCMIDVTTKIKLGWKSKIYYLNFHFLQQKVNQPCSWNCHSWIKLSSDVPVYKLDLIYLETKIIQMYYTVTSTEKQLEEHMNLNVNLYLKMIHVQ